ncbi:MAG TPA: acyl carrier protein [Candidatus Wujingus californicus]|uniref:acyl carrier protein n=1 Tax=Candidatus Wujingus californicus TaxID=3367618 RepID=UPI00402582CF
MNDLDDVEQQVRDIIAEQLQVGIQNIKKNSTIAELGGDSLKALQLLSIFETHFNISISDEDAVKINSFKNAVEVIKKNLEK